jgi:hypothetical protein
MGQVPSARRLSIARYYAPEQRVNPGASLGVWGGAKRRFGALTLGSDPMIEAGAPSTERLLACFPWCARPTGGSHVRTTHDLAQRFKGVQCEGPEPPRAPTPHIQTSKTVRYPRGSLRTVRRLLLPSSEMTSSVVSRVQRFFKRLERVTSTSVSNKVPKMPPHYMRQAYRVV